MRHACLLRPVNASPSLTLKTRTPAWPNPRTGYSFWVLCGASNLWGQPPLGPSPCLIEPPHSSSCRTPLPTASMASHMHHMSTITSDPPSLFVWHPTHAAYSPQRSPISLSTTASPRTWIVIPPLPTSQFPISTSSVTFPTLTTYTGL